MESDTWDVAAIATALSTEAKQAGILPPRIELRSDRLGIVATLRLFPDQRRVNLVVDVGRGKRKAYLAQISLRGVDRIETNPENGQVRFRLDTGDSLTVFRDGRFFIGQFPP